MTALRAVTPMAVEGDDEAQSAAEQIVGPILKVGEVVLGLGLGLGLGFGLGSGRVWIETFGQT